MKAFKRNAVIITVLLFVCVAVYLNWSYGKAGETAAESGELAAEMAAAEGTEAEAPAEDAGSLYYTSADQSGESQPANSTAAYFDTVRLSREQSRASARETLLTVSGAESAGEETAAEALDSISQMAQWAVLESTLEGEIMAKGYADCVVFITEEAVTVTVPAPTEGLSQAAVARITDIILAGTEYSAENLHIVEVK